MKCFGLSIATLGLVSLLAGTSLAEEETGSTATVKLTDPSRPCVVHCQLLNGGITVTGYDGKEVIAEALPRLKPIGEEEAAGSRDLKKIHVASSTIAVEENDNRVEITVDTVYRAADVRIKVPRMTSLELRCISSGDILVEGVTGEIEAENRGGAVTLKGVSGSVVAYTQQEDLVVDLVGVTPNTPMSFASWGGDVDVTLPAGVRASVRLKIDQGEAYSDFDFQNATSQQVTEEDGRGKDGTYRARVETAFYGDINGGGPEFQFTAYRGSVYIRKGP